MSENLDYLNVENINDKQDLTNYNNDSKNKYKKILDNLLNVNFRTDGSTLYTNITATNYTEDLTTWLNEEDLNVILNEPDFKIKIKPENYLKIKNEIEKTKYKIYTDVDILKSIDILIPTSISFLDNENASISNVKLSYAGLILSNKSGFNDFILTGFNNLENANKDEQKNLYIAKQLSSLLEPNILVNNFEIKKLSASSLVLNNSFDTLEQDVRKTIEDNLTRLNVSNFKYENDNYNLQEILKDLHIELPKSISFFDNEIGQITNVKLTYNGLILNNNLGSKDFILVGFSSLDNASKDKANQNIAKLLSDLIDEKIALSGKVALLSAIDALKNNNSQINLQKIIKNAISKKLVSDDTNQFFYTEITNFDEFIKNTKEYKLLKKSELYYLEKQPFRIVEYKEIALKNIEEKINKFLMSWRDVKKTINESYNLYGIWPYYLATYFIQCNINDKPIYAPLIFKEVDITIENNEVYLISNSDLCVLNEKLIFLLNTYKGNCPISLKDNLEEIIIKKLNLELDEYYNSIIKNVQSPLIDKFINTEKQEILQTIGPDIIKKSGIVLMFANPTGSKLRKTVIKLIEEKKLDSLLDCADDYDPFQFDNDAINNLIVNKQSIVRICKTDPSQEKAIIQALSNNLIILGPPGTGKSQTIANILANILHQQKTALFISQKKSALDVVIKRMQDLQYFCLQLVPKDNISSQKQIKEDFYDNFKILFDLLSDTDVVRKQLELTSYVSNKQSEYFTFKKKYEELGNDVFKEFIDLLKTYPKLSLSDYLLLRNLNENLDKNLFNQAYDFYKKYAMFTINDLNDLLEKSKSLNDVNLNEFKLFYEFCEKLNLDFDTLKYLDNIHTNLNEDSIKKLNDLFTKYPNLDHEKLDKLNELYTHLKNEDEFDKIKIALINSSSQIKLNIDQFASLFNFSKKGLFKKDYDKNAKDLFQRYCDLFNSLQLLQIQIPFSELVSTFAIFELSNYQKTLSTYFNLINYLKQHSLSLNDYFIIIKYFNNQFYLSKFHDFCNFYELLKKMHLNLEEYENIKESLKQFDKYFLLFSTLKELNINIEDFEKIQPLLLNKIYLDLFSDFSKPYEHLPEPNSFVSNIDSLVQEECKLFQEKINSFSEVKRKEFIKMKGKIEKAAASPEKFLIVYKEFLKELFPIFISNPEKLASFIDFENDKYDYVIFDEASQIFLEKAIPYLSIANKVIIAGDNQQMQPSNWFGIRSTDYDEDDVFEEENEESLLNYAISMGLPKQTLQSNFRSNSASLTTFSSKEFYNSELKSVNKKNVDMVPIEVIDINGTWKNSMNMQEGMKLIEIAKQNINKYDSIILLTFNEPQLQLVNELLLKDEILSKLYFEGHILLKNLENIQGDEADLVVISIGYTKDSRLTGTYVCRPGGRNALNVAITRARDKMIVLKSISAQDIIITNEENKDLITFRNWLKFLELSSEEQKEYCSLKVDLKTDFDSNFEKEVLEWLTTLHYPYPIKITNQYKVGSYRIDFAFLEEQNNKFILGLEVDGFRYHFGPKKTYNDLLRQQLLEQKGYAIIRISEYNWKVNKQELYEDIITELSYLKDKN